VFPCELLESFSTGGVEVRDMLAMVEETFDSPYISVTILESVFIRRTVLAEPISHSL